MCVAQGATCATILLEDKMDIIALIKKYITLRLNSLETIQVVKVEAVDYETYTCSVIPKTKIGTGEDMPIITGVPIAAQKSGKSVILLPPKVGDIGVVVFSKYAINNLLVNTDTVEIVLPRTFSINDAIYIGGAFTGVDIIPTIVEGEMILHHHSGTQIKFANDGKIYITG